MGSRATTGKRTSSAPPNRPLRGPAVFTWPPHPPPLRKPAEIPPHMRPPSPQGPLTRSPPPPPAHSAMSRVGEGHRTTLGVGGPGLAFWGAGGFEGQGAPSALGSGRARPPPHDVHRPHTSTLFSSGALRSTDVDCAHWDCTGSGVPPGQGSLPHRLLCSPPPPPPQVHSGLVVLGWTSPVGSGGPGGHRRTT